jgi:CoA-disulfide reductase
MSKKVIIIGGVAGGATAAARLRRMDEFAEIIMFERGEYISFANCGLPYYIGGIIPNRDSLIVQTAEELSIKFNLDIRIKSEVTLIDSTNKIVHVLNLLTQETYQETYDYIIISTGSNPITPPIPGINEANNIFTLRTIPDTDAIKNFLDNNKPKKVTIVGGGFIGIEMAENIKHLGIDVTLVEMADQVMTPLDFEMASIVHSHIEDSGVTLILKDGVKSIENHGKKVVLQSGKIIENDMIILAIGVKPENHLAKSANLTLGSRGGIHVNCSMQTSDPSIYAIGDAIEVTDFVNRKQTMIPLAGPANKQARIAADNISGKNVTYVGTMGTAVVKVFDLTVGSTGNNEKYLIANQLNYKAIHIHPNSHAGYYPGASSIALKILFDPLSEKIYGAQAIGMEGVDKRIDVLATAIAGKLKITDLENLELSYAPPFSSAKDPINMLGFAAENILDGLVDTIQWNEIDQISTNGGFILDVRDHEEYEMGHIKHAINIPLPNIRDHIQDLPIDETIHIYCQAGIRGYITSRILMQHGFTVKNLDGGYKTYQCVYQPHETAGCITEMNESGKQIASTARKEDESMKITLSVDACGLQCPGPLVQVYKSLSTMNDGDILEIIATDPGFMKDVKKWCDTTSNTLLNLSKEGKIVKATIQKGNHGNNQGKDILIKENQDNATIVVFSQDLDKAIAAFIIATGAATMGKKVTLFFTFWGLNILRKPKRTKVKKSLIEKMFGVMMPRGTNRLPISNMNMVGIGPMMIKYIMKKKNVETLQSFMVNATSMGITLVACAMSMDIMGIKQEELLDGIEIAGVGTYLGETTSSNLNLFI